MRTKLEYTVTRDDENKITEKGFWITFTGKNAEKNFLRLADFIEKNSCYSFVGCPAINENGKEGYSDYIKISDKEEAEEIKLLYKKWKTGGFIYDSKFN